MRRSLAILAVLTAIAGPAGAQSIRRVFRTAPSLVGLPGIAASGPYQNAADVILEQAIRNLPLFPAASSAYTYRWDAAQETLVRVDDAVSPWPFTERGQTLGRLGYGAPHPGAGLQPVGRRGVACAVRAQRRGARPAGGR
jgi:hypothetical protein